MFQDIFFTFWFFLPAGIANMIPVVIAKISFLETYSYPLDFYKTFRDIRIFGEHKTVRGLVGGTLVGMLIAVLQSLITPKFFAALPAHPIALGFLLSFGALVGDAVKSFFKRQLGRAPGKAWFPFDQIDYILGAIFFSFFYIRLSLSFYILAFILFFALHLGVTYIGYLLKLKDDPI